MKKEDIYNGPVWYIGFNDGFNVNYQRVFEPTKQKAIASFEKSTGFKVITCFQVKPDRRLINDVLSVENAVKLVEYVSNTNYGFPPLDGIEFSPKDKVLEFVSSNDYIPEEGLELCFQTKQGDYVDSLNITCINGRWYGADNAMGGRTISGETIEELIRNVYDHYEDKECDNCPVELIVSTDTITNVYYWVSMTGAGSEVLFKQDELNNLELIASYDEAEDEDSKADMISNIVETLASKGTVHNITLNAIDVYELGKLKSPELTYDDMGANCIIEASHQLQSSGKLRTSSIK
ncbi:TPA: hypothetical protein I7730_15930 [Vibrio vulnificus]|uniref:Uncharacterized protein n=1 Tax=Vibrio vulnificus TaxID=672 RepID=A0A8H9N1S5_VIBVL|nr:hypothetical protein [Vibrio vulnificus]HAS8541272.1 hypothetical protein [Vibrio vulnificus]